MIDLVIEDPRWDDLDLAGLAARAEEALFADLGVAAAWETTLLACDDARIAELNAAFRDKPKATNVLSWPSEERGAQTPGGTPAPLAPDMFGEMALGDLAVAYETCAGEAAAAGLALADHTAHLILHGLLHLMGYDHENDPDATLMEGIESRVLGKMGLHDPYMDR